ncbi:HpcH/HpaI aldolase family protein [Haliea sp. E17]|uniref:HpcH/HpaI aldolase family protein n=1 Tax=Haliea sp. E17 TaxID=3401576 RepID=UPI003AB01EDF
MATLPERLQAGESAFATWMAIANNISAEMIGAGGYDCAVIDTQHGGPTWDSLGGLIQAMDLNRTPSLVRVGGVDQVQIMRALDLGAAGVVVPMVSTVEQAQHAAEAMRYPPDGLRSFGKVRNYYGKEAVQAQPLCFVMIETAEGMQNLDAIAAVDGIDGLFVGPVDLGLGLGLGPVLEMHDEVLAAIGRIALACRQHGRISASASLGNDYTRALLELGVQLVVQGSDLGFIRRGMAEDVKNFRALAANNSGDAQ